jgi:hypothetical protein
MYAAVLLTNRLIHDYTFNYAWPLIYTTGMGYAGVIVVDCLVDVGERGRGDSRESQSGERSPLSVQEGRSWQRCTI